MPLVDVSFPPEVASYLFKMRSGIPVVYMVADRHCHCGTQLNIARILLQLRDQAGLELVGVEAPLGPLPVRRRAASAVTQYALQAGLTNGAELAAMQADLYIEGIEDAGRREQSLVTLEEMLRFQRKAPVLLKCLERAAHENCSGSNTVQITVVAQMLSLTLWHRAFHSFVADGLRVDRDTVLEWLETSLQCARTKVRTAEEASAFEAELPHADEGMRLAMRFYKFVDQREQKMLEHVRALIARSPDAPVAAVVGDFHAENMAKVLHELGHVAVALVPDPGEYDGEADFKRYLATMHARSLTRAH